MKTKLYFLTAIGNLCIGLGISTLNLSSFGVDPFSSMTIGTSTYLGISLGMFQMIFNALLYIPILYFNRKAFGFGAAINLFLMGYIIEFFNFITWLFSFQWWVYLIATILVIGIIILIFLEKVLRQMVIQVM